MSKLLLIGLFSAAAFAQEFRGIISGTITDAQGAAIPSAKVIATETRTGAKSQTTSEPSGAYTIPFLAPGEYDLSAEASGFKTLNRRGLSLGSGEHPVIDLRMEVGTVSESVTVTADVPLIESANASVGQVITSEEVEDMPVNGRTPLMLANLAMGVISLVEPGVQTRPFDNNTPASFSLGGAPSGTNELLYNGAPNAGFTNQIAYSPPQDAVMQVRVNAFESDASFGHTGGGTANQITKSGTNQFHGSIYEFFQHSDLAANAFYYNARGVDRPLYRYNQYGLSAGAPVWIPKVYNGRNKVFWFFAYEGLKDSDPANSPRETGSPMNFATVPTAAERQGDFSALLKANGPGKDYTIYDPATGVVSSTRVARTPFANNVIPTNRLNPISLKLLKYYPLPNTTGRADGFQNYSVNFVAANSYDNELGRVDWNVSDRNKLSADFRHSLRNALADSNFAEDQIAVLVKNGGGGTRLNQGATLDDVYTLTPTTVLDIRGNWTRYLTTSFTPTDGLDLTSLGFPASLAAASQGPMLPYMVMTSTSITAGSQAGFQSLGNNGANNQTYDVWQLFGSVATFHGNHALKAGADIRDYRWSAFTFGNSAGTYTFNSNWTNGPLNNAAASPLGQDFAAFLLGLPSSGQFDLNAQSTASSHYYGFFLQDDWRVNSNLTVNLGLRIEHESPTVERYNRAINGFDPAAQNSASAAAAAAYAANPSAGIPASQFKTLGGLTYTTPDNRAIYQTKAAFASPRVGFAWTPRMLGAGTVIRGGMGLFVVPITINGNGETNATTSLNQQGFSQSTQFVATGNNYLSPSATLSNPFPNGIQRPVGSANGASTFLGQGITFFNPNVSNPYSVRWNFGVQRALPAQMVLEVAYIGNHAVHLPITTQLDYIPRQYLTPSILRDASANTYLSATVANPFQGLLPNSSSLNGATVARRQLLIPFPQYPVPGTPSSTSNGVVMQSNGAGSSYFQSLNVRLQKRLTNGLTLINTFVYSKLIGRQAYLNDSDPAPAEIVASDSRPLREVMGVTYDLPIGRGRRLSIRSKLGDALIGGWKLNAMLSLQSGPMLTWGNVIYLGGPLSLSGHQPDGLAFDISRFVTASSAQPVDNIRYLATQFGNLRRDPSKNLDVSMGKSFPFGERRYFQLRIETFNTTNHVTFGAPNTTPTSTAFGTISSQANSPRAVQLAARIAW
jgi:hypothetical protein